jgi:phenylacetate-CoA ligase
MRPDHPVLDLARRIAAREPFRSARGVVSAYVAYPIAERVEKRAVRPKLRELRQTYALDPATRLARSQQALAELCAFAGANVPYYRDLFGKHRFDPERLRKDTAYLADLPMLTKDIVREQGDRLLSRPLAAGRHHVCRTGGSTGKTAVFYYDQEGADYSAAVTLFCRESIGKRKAMTETHLAARFSDHVPEAWPSREDFKTFAMNRRNIFFGRIDDGGLEEMWQHLRAFPTYLLHGHPSTVYALATYVERRYGPQQQPFAVFESSGELLHGYMREAIARAFGCRVVDRYGLAELGVAAYELNGSGLRILESEAWPENQPSGDPESPELVLTGLRNRLMPLIRYATGDLGTVERDEKGFRIDNPVGRVHDRVEINGVPYLTHHVQDVLGHRVGGIDEFQIDTRTSPATLRLVLAPGSSAEDIAAGIGRHWPGAFALAFVDHADLILIGSRAKFRHVVDH